MRDRLTRPRGRLGGSVIDQLKYTGVRCGAAGHGDLVLGYAM